MRFKPDFSAFAPITTLQCMPVENGSPITINFKFTLFYKESQKCKTEGASMASYLTLVLKVG